MTADKEGVKVELKEDAKEVDKTFFDKQRDSKRNHMTKFVPLKNVEIDRNGQAKSAASLDNNNSQGIFELTAEQIKEFGACTIVAPPFNAGRLSWHLVLDIDEQRNLSVWVILRGPPLESDELPPIMNDTTPCFSSLITDFQVTVESRVVRLPLFHSFAH